ncbi:hypothetical protein Hsw_PA0107 (plasmid) [Hymenobacter swuensis DY53]|uniref:Uncharacterized protein n=1 Tax=Hymenobacter swuensis DY53 TaxID=1227739 RepID=W8F0T8_9BACT|nr:hypothetical protein Hsw_PA0107 [Hymenobacter swuensis DY53]
MHGGPNMTLMAALTPNGLQSAIAVSVDKVLTSAAKPGQQ